MEHKVQISASFAFSMDGIGIRIIREWSGNRQILRLHPDGSRDWEDVPELVMTSNPCTMMLQNDEARELLEQLMRHYQGASDMHTVRADLLHERGRVDKLIDHMTKTNSALSAISAGKYIQ